MTARRPHLNDLVESAPRRCRRLLHHRQERSHARAVLQCCVGAAISVVSSLKNGVTVTAHASISSFFSLCIRGGALR